MARKTFLFQFFDHESVSNKRKKITIIRSFEFKTKVFYVLVYHWRAHSWLSDISYTIKYVNVTHVMAPNQHFFFCLRLVQKFLLIKVNSIYSYSRVSNNNRLISVPVFATCVHCFCHFLLRMQFLYRYVGIEFCFKYRVYCLESTECLLFAISSLAVREKCCTVFSSVAFPHQTIYQT